MNTFDVLILLFVLALLGVLLYWLNRKIDENLARVSSFIDRKYESMQKKDKKKCTCKKPKCDWCGKDLGECRCD